MQQIVKNLLSNGAKFTPPGGEVTVHCGLNGQGGVCIEVVDTGVGIAPENQKQIFQPFTQVDQSLARKHEGVGMGLPLALRLTEFHHGKLQLTSVVGEGTRVWVTFPPERSIATAAKGTAEAPPRRKVRNS